MFARLKVSTADAVAIKYAVIATALSLAAVTAIALAANGIS